MKKPTPGVELASSKKTHFSLAKVANLALISNVEFQHTEAEYRLFTHQMGEFERQYFLKHFCKHVMG